nr:phenolic glucoside malonyltransferase 2-like [Malus domestica]
MAVKVIQVCRVAPQPGSSAASAIPTQGGKQTYDGDTAVSEAIFQVNHALPAQDYSSLPLTFIDLLWLRYPPFHRLFFYNILPFSSPADTLLFFHSIIIPKLKTSLSLTLQHFLPLAGNITWPENSPKPTLNYVKGDTVSLTVAESDADFHHLSSNDFNIDAKEYHPLVPQLENSHEKAAVMAFQITVFPNSGGFSIGISMHHAVVDGKTLFMFLKSWTHICRHVHQSDDVVLPDQLKPFYDRRGMKDPIFLQLEEIYLNQFLNMDRQQNNRSLMVAARYKSLVISNSTRGNFEFTSAKIQALRKWIMARKQQEGHDRSVHLSTFSLTCAYSWICLLKAEQEEQDEVKGDKIIPMVINVDCRSRLTPPLPANYFGNCVTARLALAERKGLLGEDGLIVAVNAISEAIKGLDDGSLMNGAENLVSSLYPSDEQTSSGAGHRRFFTTAGSHRFDMYDTDFGWGRPRSTEVVRMHTVGTITFADGKNGGGAVDIGLVLKKHHMEAFASLFAKGSSMFLGRIGINNVARKNFGRLGTKPRTMVFTSFSTSTRRE